MQLLSKLFSLLWFNSHLLVKDETQKGAEIENRD